MSESRVYVVVDRATEGEADEAHYLVRATNPAQAARHVTRSRFSVEVASQDDLIRLMGASVKVEDATVEPPTLQPPAPQPPAP